MAAKGTIILLLRQWLVNFYEDGVRARPLKRRRSIRYTTQLDDLVAAELDELRFSPARRSGRGRGRSVSFTRKFVRGL